VWHALERSTSNLWNSSIRLYQGITSPRFSERIRSLVHAIMWTFNGTATCSKHATAPDPSTRYQRAKRAPAIVDGRHLAAAAHAAEGRP
jgi:hypothetical protein